MGAFLLASESHSVSLTAREIVALVRSVEKISLTVILFQVLAKLFWTRVDLSGDEAAGVPFITGCQSGLCSQPCELVAARAASVQIHLMSDETAFSAVLKSWNSEVLVHTLGRAVPRRGVYILLAGLESLKQCKRFYINSGAYRVACSLYCWF